MLWHVITYILFTYLLNLFAIRLFVRHFVKLNANELNRDDKNLAGKVFLASPITFPICLFLFIIISAITALVTILDSYPNVFSNIGELVLDNVKKKDA